MVWSKQRAANFVSHLIYVDQHSNQFKDAEDEVLAEVEKAVEISLNIRHKLKDWELVYILDSHLKKCIH